MHKVRSQSQRLNLVESRPLLEAIYQTSQAQLKQVHKNSIQEIWACLKANK